MVEVASSLRELEAASIRAFVEGAAADGFLSGRVLDYGCGNQPYRAIVEAAGGTYFPCDREDFPANVSGGDIGEDEIWDDYNACLCTQVVQYVPDISDFMVILHSVVSQERGHLVLTYPTNWPEVEPEDLHRFTKAGMERLLTEAGFTILRHERRGFVQFGADTFNLGHGVICRA